MLINYLIFLCVLLFITFRETHGILPGPECLFRFTPLHLQVPPLVTRFPPTIQVPIKDDPLQISRSCRIISNYLATYLLVLLFNCTQHIHFMVARYVLINSFKIKGSTSIVTCLPIDWPDTWVSALYIEMETGPCVMEAYCTCM